MTPSRPRVVPPPDAGPAPPPGRSAFEAKARLVSA